MIRHIVLIDFLPEASQEAVDEAIDRLNALPSQIPEIRAWRIHETIATRNGSYRFALVSEFDDLDAVERYLAHPAHDAVVAANASILRSFAENDHAID
jgi:quinol monooxygenase YgiN